MPPLFSQHQQNIAKLLSIVLDDDEYLYHVNKINEETVRITEKMMNDLMFCNRATTVLFAGLRCVPKSANVYGWLLGCLPAVVDVANVYKDKLQASLLCHSHIKVTYRSAIKMTLLRSPSNVR